MPIARTLRRRSTEPERAENVRRERDAPGSDLNPELHERKNRPARQALTGARESRALRRALIRTFFSSTKEEE